MVNAEFTNQDSYAWELPDWKNDKWIKPHCLAPGHNPPMHLYIPAGEFYVHTCPACGYKVTMHGQPVT